MKKIDESKYKHIEGIDVDAIVRRADLMFGTDLKNKSRKAEYVIIRAALIAAISNILKVGPSQSARAFDCDHATILHHVRLHDFRYKKIGAWCETYTPWYDRFVSFLDSNSISDAEFIFANALIGRLGKTVYKRDVVYVRI